MSTGETEEPRGAPPLAPDEVPILHFLPALPEDWPADGLGPPSQIERELPDPLSLPGGSWIAVGAGHRARRGLVARFLGSRSGTGMHLAVRCTALLSRGYVEVCADEAGTAYGRVPG